MSTSQPRRTAWPLPIAVCLSVALLAAPAALAQPAGGREIAPSGATVPGASVPRDSDTTAQEHVRERLRDAEVAPSGERAREQLRDLNAISRQLAPSVTPPAPQVEPRR